MKCPHCREEMPDDGTEVPMNWYFAHIEDPWHGRAWKLYRKWGRLLCYFGFHKHPESSAPAWWTCERVDCQREFHQRW